MLTVISFLIMGLVQTDTELAWLTNFEEAKSEARKSGKHILMRFTGSDWCGNCIRLDTTLIETPQFEEFAKGKFVLLYVDFPVKEENKLAPKLAAHNERLQTKYNPSKGFPAMVVLNAEGEALGQMNVASNTAEGFIELLEEILESN